MEASQKNPTYTVYVVSGGTKYNITSACSAIDRTESDGTISQRVTLEVLNVKVEGNWLSGILQAVNRVFVYANDGSRNDEVFRGYLWDRGYKSSLKDHQLKYVCYDNLIYLQKSEESLFFSAGKKTKDIFTSICGKWGIPLSYSYDSINHEKMPLKGNIYNIFTDDILDKVKKKTKKKYVILSDKDTMYVKPVGANSTVYQFIAGKNVISTTSGWTMDGVITKVVIVGKADDNKREPIEAIVTGDTDKYGTLQKIQGRSEDSSIANAKLEAKNTIDEHGHPKWEYELEAPDIPWIRKGDKVFVNAGDIVSRYLIVTAVDRAFDSKTSSMTLTMEDE